MQNYLSHSSVYNEAFFFLLMSGMLYNPNVIFALKKKQRNFMCESVLF